MSMHLVGPYMTTTQYKRKKKKPNAKQQRAQEDHDKWLLKMGVHPEQLAEKKANRKDVKTMDVPSYVGRNTNRIHTSDRIDGVAPAKERKVYTGDLIVGIGTMHKSNAVPIMRGTNEAKEIAKMRR